MMDPRAPIAYGDLFLSAAERDAPAPSAAEAGTCWTMVPPPVCRPDLAMVTTICWGEEVLLLLLQGPSALSPDMLRPEGSIRSVVGSPALSRICTWPPNI